MNQSDRNSISPTAGPGPPREREATEDREQRRALAAELAVAEERERRRIANGLHDQVGQLLGVAKIKLGEALAAGPAAEVAEPVSKSRDLIDRAIHEIHALSFELSSPVLYELGIEAALEALAERMERRHGIPCRFEGAPEPVALTEESAVLTYSIVRELLWNVVKHARARQVVLALRREERRLRIVVEDDGVGFDATRAFDGRTESGGLGLVSARVRLEPLGGSLEAESAPGRGARMVLTVPR